MVPLTESQLAEECSQLKAHNIILFESERACVDAALRKLPRRRRPLLKTDDDEGWSCGASIDSSEIGDSDPQMLLVVEHTFWKVSEFKQDLSEASKMIQSAPAELGDSMENLMLQNPRRGRSSCLEDLD